MNPRELEDFCRSGGGTWASRMALAAYLLQWDAHLAQRLENKTRAQAAAQEALYPTNNCTAMRPFPQNIESNKTVEISSGFLQREQ